MQVSLNCTIVYSFKSFSWSVEVTPKGWGHMHLIVLSSKYCLEAITDAYASQSSVQQIKKQWVKNGNIYMNKPIAEFSGTSWTVRGPLQILLLILSSFKWIN